MLIWGFDFHEFCSKMCPGSYHICTDYVWDNNNIHLISMNFVLKCVLAVSADYLRDNNEKMKIQYQNLSEWKEKIRVNNTKNKEKFDQTREVVQSLTKENEELRREATSKVHHYTCNYSHTDL